MFVYKQQYSKRSRLFGSFYVLCMRENKNKRVTTDPTTEVTLSIEMLLEGLLFVRKYPDIEKETGKSQ